MVKHKENYSIGTQIKWFVRLVMLLYQIYLYGNFTM